ncbi:MAG: hypothetical protein HY332_16930 [Chloroflexi bacterium]|nr:hypothetical protein [Chloroflexota bacterium]
MTSSPPPTTQDSTQGTAPPVFPFALSIDVTPAHVELGVDPQQRELGPLWLALEEAGYEVVALLLTRARLKKGEQTAWYQLDENGYQLMAAGLRGEPIQPCRVTLTLID